MVAFLKRKNMLLQVLLNDESKLVIRVLVIVLSFDHLEGSAS
jgi:hypothetical protein